MSQVTIRLLGTEGVLDVLSAVPDAITPKRIEETAGAVFLNRIRTRFRDAVDPDGKPWRVSKAAEIRKLKGINQKTLFDTGRLFHSIQLHPTVEGFSISTDVPYGKIQQEEEGRVFLGWGTKDRIVLKRIVKGLIDAKIS